LRSTPGGIPGKAPRQRCQGGDRQDQKNTAGSTWLQLEA
jgi:hypothetical protein